jgi:carbonic anhydrase/acetyltransferase-like protein (isoleucine patch superfamily)
VKHIGDPRPGPHQLAGPDIGEHGVAPAADSELVIDDDMMIGPNARIHGCQIGPGTTR